jgi:Family of unknown function (DUF5946)
VSDVQIDAGAAPETTACPGCGAVLAVVPGPAPGHPGASPSCAALFAVTVRGLRDEAGRDARAAALLQLATDTYDAQHLVDGGGAGPVVRLCLQLDRGVDPARARELTGATGAVLPGLARPAHWTTTLPDIAADLDVVDLSALVRSWAGAVWADWAPTAGPVRAAADRAVGS